MQKVTKDEIEKMKELYEKLGSLRKVAEAMDYSRDTISRYVFNKPKRKYKSEVVTSWRRKRKEELVNYKGGECQICGYKRCISALEFHHINPNEKDFTISGRNLSLDKMIEEVDKCVLLCSNCHKEVHSGITEIKL